MTGVAHIVAARRPRGLSPLDDKRLIRRLKRRDPQAFTELVSRYQSPIYNLCYRMLGQPSEAEDIAQDVFIKAFVAIGGFRGDSSLGTWLYRVAINLCKNRIKYLGRRHHQTTDAIDDVPEGAWSRGTGGRSTVGEAAPRPDQALEGRRAHSRVLQALTAIEPEFRELLVLRDIQGLSYHEVMRITGLPEGTVKSRLHRARAALRRAYDAPESIE